MAGQVLLLRYGAVPELPASCVNPGCAAVDAQAPHRLSGESARILSYTSDWLSYKPCPPFLFGHVRFESGARVLMSSADCEEGELAVGAPLRMVFRIKDTDPPARLPTLLLEGNRAA